MTFSDLLNCFYPYTYVLSWFRTPAPHPKWKSLLFKFYSGQNLTQCHIDSCVFVRMSNSFDIHPAQSLLFLFRNWETESHRAISWAKVCCSSEATIVLLPIQSIQGIIKLEGGRKTEKYIYFLFSFLLWACATWMRQWQSFLKPSTVRLYLCPLDELRKKWVKFWLHLMSPYFLSFYLSDFTLSSQNFSTWF